MTRKYAVLFALLIGLLVATSASAQFSHIKNIVASPHNLSISGTSGIHGTDATYAAQICLYCHKPHQSSKAGHQPPLWNHKISAITSYGFYSSPTFDSLGTGIADVGSAALGSATITNLCLSCHDGTIGVNEVYSSSISGVTTALDAGTGVNNPVYVGHATTDLSRIHPVNFTYDAALAAKVPSLAVPTQTLSLNSSLSGNMYVIAASGSNGGFLPLFPTPGAGGTSPRMQCATCHDVHDDTTNPRFLRDTLTGSKLCLDCHGAS